jgi:threonine dehydrogenase-like Zn-dependent dehydrogenase
VKSIVLTKPGRLELEEVEQPPQPGPGEVQVRVHRVGICGTDIHAFGGSQPFFSYPRILGHELAVEIVEIGSSVVEDLQVGDTCCVRPYLNCGHCGACRRGFENCCVNMRVLGVHRDGGMREVINLPADKLHKSSS